MVSGLGDGVLVAEVCLARVGNLIFDLEEMIPAKMSGVNSLMTMTMRASFPL